MDKLLEMVAAMPLVAQVLSAVVGLNLVVLGFIKILEVIKDKTKTEVDNKLHALLSKIQTVLALMVAYKK